VNKNPFVFHGPVTEPDMAYFRDTRAMDSIVNGLLLGNYYTLLGPRFSGITSMTWDILRTAREREKHCRCLYIDLQALDSAVDERSLFQGIAKIGQWLPLETALPWSDVTSCAHFREALSAAVRGKPARLIMALDHLDSESLPYELVKMLVRCTRVLYNERLTDPEYHKISVLIGGSQSPYTLSTGSGSPFNIAEKYWLRDLTPQEVEELIWMGQRLSGIFFDDAAIARIIAATEGDKYFVQGICHQCIREAQNAGTQTVTEAAVSGMIERLVSMDYREDRCFMLLVRSLKRGPDLMGILVDLLEGKEAVASECQADVNKMQLTGVLKVEKGNYRFRNEVYERFLSRRKVMIKDGWKIHTQAKKLRRLHDVTLGMTSALDPGTALKEATWMVLRTSEADTVAIYLFDKTIDRFRLEAVASTEELHVADSVLRRDKIAREVVASQRPSIVKDWTFCNECDLCVNPCSCIWLPLVVSNDVLGTMVIAFGGHHDFLDENEILIAEIMASHLATLVIRTKLLDALENGKAEFEANVQALLKRSASPLFTTTQSDCTLSLSCRPAHRINIRVSGIVALSAVSRGVLDIDMDAYARQGNNVPLLDWRFNSKQWGKQLYQQIFVSHPEVLSNYNQALGEVGEEEKLHLCFESSRDFLRVPLEFLFDEVSEQGDYLVLRHPLVRSTTGVRMKRMPLSPAFFNDLWAKGDKLRILLIASNTIPAIPSVDAEIRALDTSLKAMFEDKGISAHVKAIPTAQATYKTVRKELQECKYHIFHYAGHGTYDRQSPEKSCLSFWEKPHHQGVVKEMPISELRILLRGSDLHFVYLSCCLGTKTGEPAKLLDDDFLGIADGIVHAGVPAVLGFRWPVSDRGGKKLALAFYKSLARQGQIDTALLAARCEVAALDRDDITWLSPILIMQA
jgi:hypothetical protein